MEQSPVEVVVTPADGDVTCNDVTCDDVLSCPSPDESEIVTMETENIPESPCSTESYSPTPEETPPPQDTEDDLLTGYNSDDRSSDISSESPIPRRSNSPLISTRRKYFLSFDDDGDLTPIKSPTEEDTPLVARGPPVYRSTPDLPATISPKVRRSLLRGKKVQRPKSFTATISEIHQVLGH
eukprot:sb/3471614/